MFLRLTTLDASAVGDRTDVGRLASPLFPQEREVSANPFDAPFFHSLSSIEKSRPDVNQCSSVEKSITRNHNQRKSSRDSGVQGSQMEAVRRKIFIISVIGKLIKPSKEKCAAQTKLSESHRMELYQANQLTDQPQREKSWFVQ